MNSKGLKVGVLGVILGAVVAFFVFDLKQYTTLDFLKENLESFQGYYQQNVLVVLLVFGLIYVVGAALSLPGAALMTVLAGAIFGFVAGLILVSFASTMGATCAFLSSRFLLKDSVQQKYGKHLSRINQGFEQEGAFYLFALRLVPAMPFFAVNILMGLVPITIWRFYWVSQLGMLAGTAVYVYAGTELSKIDSLSGLVSPKLLLAFVGLGLFPVLAKKWVNILRNKRNG